MTQFVLTFYPSRFKCEIIGCKLYNVIKEMEVVVDNDTLAPRLACGPCGNPISDVEFIGDPRIEVVEF
jgi:hypothetical protein